MISSMIIMHDSSPTELFHSDIVCTPQYTAIANAGASNNDLALNHVDLAQHINYPASPSSDLDYFLNLLFQQTASYSSCSNTAATLPLHQHISQHLANADRDFGATPAAHTVLDYALEMQAQPEYSNIAAADQPGAHEDFITQLIGLQRDPQNDKLRGPLRKRACVGPTLAEIESALRRIPAHCSAAADSLSASPLVSRLETPNVSAGSHHGPSILAVSPSHQPRYCPRRLSCKGIFSMDKDDTLLRCARRSRLQWTSSNLQPRYKVTIKCNQAYAVNSDGYKWHKYGQKTIKSSPYPRNYYKCSTRECQVRKQVERCTADMLLVTYEGLHLHYRP